VTHQYKGRLDGVSAQRARGDLRWVKEKQATHTNPRQERGFPHGKKHIYLYIFIHIYIYIYILISGQPDIYTIYRHIYIDMCIDVYV